MLFEETEKVEFVYYSVKKPKLDLVSDAEKSYLELIKTLPSVCEISRRIHEPKFIDLESVIHYWKVLKVFACEQFKRNLIGQN